MVVPETAVNGTAIFFFKPSIMKKLLLLLLLAVTTMSATVAPVSTYRVYKVRIYRTETKQQISVRDTDFRIDLNGPVIKLDNQQGSVFFTSVQSFREHRDSRNNLVSTWDAYDEENIRCYVSLVKFYLSGSTALMVEYTDYTFIYYYQ